ncbi:CCA tRNA nucleotidyltransferase [Deinococcus cavernae]|uniref:CCA tRNA nucleotidyltransferase n=1 Tax=Deinococcus cavernae TaxID=2320857 RepID=UPI001F1A2FCA|nr:CCA tRNA nucleotidyltransferase [Deinococcus cavernae]
MSERLSGKDILARLRPGDQAWLTELAGLAGPAAQVALVGGAVRDALLGVTPLDLDVVVDGVQVEELAHASGWPFVYHPAFQNATLHLPDGRFADLVRARRESYPVPGQNPVPEPGTLADDLRRRDFTVNALALRLGPEPELLDVAGGQRDLDRRFLRPLHRHSFHEDASRLVRGARIAARLDLQATPELLEQVPDALHMAPQTPRLWAELKLLLQEARPYLAALKLREWGAGELLPDLGVLAALDELPDVNPQTYAAGLLATAPDTAALAQRLSLGDKPAALLSRALSDTFYPPGTPERQLRSILNPHSYVPLTGKDVLALGVPAGRQVGEALTYLAELRRAGRVNSQLDEQLALRDYVKNAPD